MDLEKRLSYILYKSYALEGKKFNSEETKEFFDIELSRELLKKNYGNTFSNLLEYFDFSGIFNNQFGELQINLLMFMVERLVKGADSLLENTPYEVKENILFQLYEAINDYRFFPVLVLLLRKDEDKVIFFNKMINRISDTEIINLIRELYENGCDYALPQILQDERVANIAVKCINSPFFYEMVEKYNLPVNFVERRYQDLNYIIVNYQEYSPYDVKNAYAELFFHDKAQNVYLDMKTIYEAAIADDEVKTILGEHYNTIGSLINFFSNLDMLTDIDIPTLGIAPNINGYILNDLFEKCKNHFMDNLTNEVKKDVYEGITPKIYKSSTGEDVKVYEFENQGEKQSHLPMIVSTTSIFSDATSGFKEIYHSEENGEVVYHRRSFSVLNETKLGNRFGVKNRITFGYEDLSHRKLAFSTIMDGGTDGNDIRFGRQRRIRENSFLPFDQFVSKTYTHNEILLEMDGVDEPIKPSYILITKLPPTQKEVDVAAEFGIPIRYVNIEKYEQVPSDKNIEVLEYDYLDFDRKPISKVQSMNQEM